MSITGVVSQDLDPGRAQPLSHTTAEASNARRIAVVEDKARQETSPRSKRLRVQTRLQTEDQTRPDQNLSVCPSCR